MWRFLAGGASALLLAGAGLFLWQARQSDTAVGIAAAPFAAQAQNEAMPVEEPPAASEKTREEKRFSRYDKDRDGAVARDEYLAARRKAFAKLDGDGDGRLSFEEYAVKTIGKFTAADRSKDGRLDPAEFATTRLVRRSRAAARCDCRAEVAQALAAQEADD